VSLSSPTASAPAYVRSPSVAFLNSLSVDRPLVRFDLAGSIAHVEMLGRVGLLPPAEVRTIVGGLRQVAAEVSADQFPWRDDLEDVHTNVEVRLTELIGPVAGKLHTGRSRNDQVALDERLYLRAAVHAIATDLIALESRLLERAAESVTQPMPGYTHLQRAQLVSVAHWYLAHFWRFERDLDRLYATAARADVSPLGAGALAGSTLPLDPESTARRLGFPRAFDNSLDAVSDRDGFAELLFDLALLAVHASSLGEEMVLFASAEFGFLRPNPALGAGSSLMPQKRNPDVAELVRGKTGRTLGDLVSLLVTLKGLPLAYNRDLQEDKAPVADSLAAVSTVLEAMSVVIAGIEFDPARLQAAGRDAGLVATDRAEALVAQGVPFREAHETVARTLRTNSAAPALPVNPLAALEARSSPGGPAPRVVAVQLEHARRRLAAHTDSLSSLGRKVAHIEELLNEVEKPT
jgi:argininosuccinate lyase